MLYKVPILILCYNRPELTKKVIEVLALIEPAKLYISSDGPANYSDKRWVAETRCLFENLTWKCKVSKLYRDENFGCRIAVKNGIDWFFENEPYGIILEDDCIPHMTAFPYFEELLIKYESNEKIMHINGVNYQRGKKHGSNSYYFSKIANINGWATWRRSWSLYDRAKEDFEEFSNKNIIASVFDNIFHKSFWMGAFEYHFYGTDKSWSWSYLFNIINYNGLAITPNVNLISNIGYGASSTHTKNNNSWLANMKTENIGIPLSHPKKLAQCKTADKITNNNFFRAVWYVYGLKNFLKLIKLFDVTKSWYYRYKHIR
jgi:hypothetical protein